MTRIRGQKKKGQTQEKFDLNAPGVDAASRQAADPVITEDATVPLHPVEVISSIPVIQDPNTATDQQGRMETDPAPRGNKRHRSDNSGSRESSPEGEESDLELLEKLAVKVSEEAYRRLTASRSECTRLHDLVQELNESNKKLTDSAAQKDTELVSLRRENEALKLETSEIAALRVEATYLKEQIATRDSQIKAYLTEAEQAKKTLEDLTKDLEAERQAAVLRYKASPHFDRALKLLSQLALQYGYTLGVDESKAKVPDVDVDITVLPHYKELYNPKAGELYKKLLSELANGEDIVKKYL